MEKHNKFDMRQAGFRPQRETGDQVLRLVQDATDNMQGNGKSHTTAACFFDMENAFDKVWRNGLVKIMISIGQF